MSKRSQFRFSLESYNSMQTLFLYMSPVRPFGSILIFAFLFKYFHLAFRARETYFLLSAVLLRQTLQYMGPFLLRE